LKRHTPTGYSCRLSARKKPEKPRQFTFTLSPTLNLHSGRIVDATIKAVVVEADGETRYQVDFERDRTAIVRAWQIVEE